MTPGVNPAGVAKLSGLPRLCSLWAGAVLVSTRSFPDPSPEYGSVRGVEKHPGCLHCCGAGGSRAGRLHVRVAKPNETEKATPPKPRGTHHTSSPRLVLLEVDAGGPAPRSASVHRSLLLVPTPPEALPRVRRELRPREPRCSEHGHLTRGIQAGWVPGIRIGGNPQK